MATHDGLRHKASTIGRRAASPSIRAAGREHGGDQVVGGRCAASVTEALLAFGFASAMRRFAGIIEHMFPDLPKLEMFARGAHRKGWDYWGAEADSVPAAA